MNGFHDGRRPRGRLVIINGGSSAGKSTLCRELQNHLMPTEVTFHLGIDAFGFALPSNSIQIHNPDPTLFSTKEYVENGKPYFEIVPGPTLDRCMAARWRAVRGCLDSGISVVADEVCWKEEWLKDAVHIFKGYDVYFVGAFVSDAEGERREVFRKDRANGWNRASQRVAHRWSAYDIEIDTTDKSPQELASWLKARLEETKPKVFDLLRLKYGEDG